MKFQVPNSKSQANPKVKVPSRSAEAVLEFEVGDLFGFWNLDFEAFPA